MSKSSSPRETDFESVVVTTWLGPVKIVPHRHHHEQVFKVSTLHSPRETDFESVDAQKDVTIYCIHNKKVFVLLEMPSDWCIIWAYEGNGIGCGINDDTVILGKIVEARAATKMVRGLAEVDQ
ncbi:hypothetical protein EV702DRAFT_1046156 [Suillus placidus]|uniref:Uncharacterized protein n=1 Tax=Suillus placidus TaxID=48579 RepID=A0A9P6ZU71_9AGAM|nr:hypothetical protein EV702DRAFT_1046156 [Suillus placidus]